MLHLEDIRWGNAGLWWILLLPLLLAPVYAWYWAFRRRVVSEFTARSAVPAMIQRGSRGRIVAAAICAFLALELLSVAVLRPKYGLKEVTVRGVGVDVCIVLDSSRSMKAADVAPDRITAATVEIGRLLDLMKGNRVALVPFAGLAFVQTPLTLDYEVVKAYLAGLRVTDIPVPGTALGRALKTASRALGLGESEAGGSTHKVVIVFTDGENHEGDPAAVAADMAAEGVRLYTVGVGTPAGQPIPTLSEDGQVNGTAREADGVTPILSRLNEELLKEVAEQTGGKYLALTGVGNVSDQIRLELEAVEKAEYRSRVEKLLEDRFQYPLAAAVVFMMISLLLLGGRSGRFVGVVVAGFLFASSPASAQGLFEMDHGEVDAAIELFRQGRFGDSAKALSEVEAQLPARPDLLYDLALARDAAGDHGESVEALDRSLGVLVRSLESDSRWPSRARLLHAKGTVLSHQAIQADKEKKPPLEVRGIWRQAVKAFTEALLLDPESEATRRNLELAAMAAYPSCSKMDDPHEPNNTANEARFLQPDPNTLGVNEHLLLCSGDQDFFKLPLNPGETLVAGVLEPGDETDDATGDAAGGGPQKPAPARVDLSLLDPDGVVLSPRGKQARYAAGETATILLQVEGPEEEDGIGYVLQAQVIPPCPAGDDAMEDNDTTEAARPVADGEHPLRACPGDDDWFAYTEQQGAQKQITLAVQSGEGPLEMEVFSADGSTLDIRAEDGEQGTQLSALLPKAEQEAPFYIRVFAGGGQGFYTLVIQDPSGNGGSDQQQQQQQQQQQPKPQAGSQTIRELLEAIDRNEENLEAQEASRNFPYRDHVPEKDW